MDHNQNKATYARLLRAKIKSINPHEIEESFNYTSNKIKRYLSDTHNKSILHAPKETRAGLRNLQDALKSTEAAIRLLNLPGEILIRRYGIKPDCKNQIDLALEAVKYAISDAKSLANKTQNTELDCLIGYLRLHFEKLLANHKKKPSKKLIVDLFDLVVMEEIRKKNAAQKRNSNKFNWIDYKAPKDIGRHYDQSTGILDILAGREQEY